jgi:hypothetical protein
MNPTEEREEDRVFVGVDGKSVLLGSGAMIADLVASDDPNWYIAMR